MRLPRSNCWRRRLLLWAGVGAAISLSLRQVKVKRTTWVRPVGIGLGVLGFSGFAIWLMLLGLPTSPDASFIDIISSIGTTGILIIGFFGVVMFAIVVRGALWTAKVLQELTERVLVFDRGFTQTIRDDTNVYLWEDISEIEEVEQEIRTWSGDLITTITSYQVHLKDGSRIDLDELKDIKELGSIIQQEVSKQQLRR